MEQITISDIVTACETLPKISKKDKELPVDKQIENLKKRYCSNVTIEMLEKKCSDLKRNIDSGATDKLPK